MFLRLFKKKKEKSYTERDTLRRCLDVDIKKITTEEMQLYIESILCCLSVEEFAIAITDMSDDERLKYANKMLRYVQEYLTSCRETNEKLCEFLDTSGKYLKNSTAEEMLKHFNNNKAKTKLITREYKKLAEVLTVNLNLEGEK